MAIAYSRLTAQGQISVPAGIRKKLGLGPGSVLEWDEDGGRIVVRRSGRFTLEDIRKALTGKRRPAPPTLEELKEAIRKRTREKYARG